MNKKMASWKVILVSFVCLLILILSQGVASIWFQFNLYGVESVLSAITYVGVSYFFVKLLVEKGLKLPLDFFRIKAFRLKISWIVMAVVLSVAVISSFVLFVGGEFQANNYSSSENLSILLPGIFFTGFAAGIVEEMIFRGIIMKVIEMRGRTKLAIILPSFLFGCLHLLNGRLSFVSASLLIIGGTVVGIMFSLMAYFNNSIWASAVMHIIWNIFIIGGICTIGIAKDLDALSSYVLNTNKLLITGGEFGIEVSLFSILGYLSIIVFLIVRHRKSEKLKLL